MKLRIGAYDRVSLEEQADGYSLNAQKAALKEYCEKKGYELVDVYSDEGESAKDFERPEVQRLFRDLLFHDKLDAILVWKVDRLSRNNSDVLSLIDKELKPRNKRILVSTCDIDSSTPVGYMFISLLSTFAQYERETIIDRVHLGMDKRAESGHWNGGIVYGYDCVDGALVVNEVEKNQDVSHLSKEVLILQKELKIQNEKREKAFNEYDNNEMSAPIYNQTLERINGRIETIEVSIHNLNKEIAKTTQNNNLSKDLVSEALLNFNELFAIASAEERKMLVRSIIKEIEVEEDRKEIKKITF